MMKELLDLIIDTIESAGLELSATIAVGTLPKDGGISVQIVDVPNVTTFLSKGTVDNMNLLFLMKSEDPTLCISELYKIGDYLRKLKTYPNTATIEWSNSIATGPQWVDEEDNGRYIYSMVVTNLINSKGV